MISALPIEETDWKSWNDTGAQAVAAKIAGVWVYSIHLDYTKYGPHNACFDKDSVSTILADESNRRRQAEQIAEWTGSSPGIVAGDLNSPSHQDWTAGAAASHCGYTVDWPTTRAFTNRGFTDSFRQLTRTRWPSPATPGRRWSRTNRRIGSTTSSTAAMRSRRPAPAPSAAGTAGRRTTWPWFRASRFEGFSALLWLP